MKFRSFWARWFFIMLLAALGVGVLGCPQLKKLFVEPPSEELIMESYSVLFAGYQQTVTVKAAPEEFHDYLINPGSWLDIADVEMPVEEIGREQSMSIGSSFPFAIRKLGYEFSGRMILVKGEQDKLWFIWDNPQMLQVQRWNFEPAKEGIRLTLRVETESPRGLDAFMEMAEKMGVMESVCAEIDKMLAGIQVHFDNSLNPDELLEKGLRGEMYENMCQAHEGNIWIDASPEEVVNWMFESPERIYIYLPEIRLSEDCRDFTRLGEQPLNEVFHCQSEYRWAGVQFPVDMFVTRSVKGRDLGYSFYMLGMGMVVRIKLLYKPEAGGTRAYTQILSEIPTGMTPGSMDLMMILLDFPKRLKESLTKVKAGVEGPG